jgi:hypothetical protein
MAAASYGGAKIMSCEGRRISPSVGCEFSWLECQTSDGQAMCQYRWANLLMDSGVLSLNYAARSLAGHSSLRILETIENVQDITNSCAVTSALAWLDATCLSVQVKSGQMPCTPNILT